MPMTAAKTSRNASSEATGRNRVSLPPITAATAIGIVPANSPPRLGTSPTRSINSRKVHSGDTRRSPSRANTAAAEVCEATSPSRR